MFQLTTREVGSKYDSDERKAARVNRTQEFATFTELKRHAMDVEGVPASAFNRRNSYTFQGWVWTWAEVAEVPAQMITQVMKLKGEIKGLVSGEGAIMISELDWDYVARVASGETRGNSVRTYGIWQNAMYLANFGTTPAE